MSLNNRTIRAVTFTQSIRSCLFNYATFEGRAPRSEYWYWALFLTFNALLFSVIDRAVSGTDFEHVGFMYVLFSLSTFFPDTSVTLRRCVDANISKIWTIPVILFSSLNTINHVILYTSDNLIDIFSYFSDMLVLVICASAALPMIFIGLKGSRKHK